MNRRGRWRLASVSHLARHHRPIFSPTSGVEDGKLKARILATLSFVGAGENIPPVSTGTRALGGLALHDRDDRIGQLVVSVFAEPIYSGFHIS